jgi:archaellum component FlaC
LKHRETQFRFNASSGRQREIAIAFMDDWLLQGKSMATRDSVFSTATQRTVSGLAIVFLVLGAFFGFLNIQKVKALRTDAATAQVARDAAERRHAQQTNTPMGGTSRPEQQKRIAEAENRAAKAEAELAQAQKEKADLQAKLDANQQEIASLQKRTEDAEKAANAPVGRSSPIESAQTGDLQSQVDDLRRQLDSAEKEKAFLAEKIHDTQERTAPPKETKKRRETASIQRETVSSHRAGVHGTVLAYNQAYNFVVLNLGARNGVEANSEMLILRDGTLIGKIRISSVEPATSIGDIITNSLARGVQVQPGDNVVYAGTNP